MFTLKYELQGLVADKDYIRCTIYPNLIFVSNIKTLDMKYTVEQTDRQTSLPYLFIIIRPRTL
jgi:hypothetical protein